MTFVKPLITAVLYAGLALGANPLFSADQDNSGFEHLKIGDMRKLAFHAASEVELTKFFDESEMPIDISAFAGKVVLLNFWATWCTPCREEMPSLDALHGELGGEDFAVIAVASGRNPLPIIQQFYHKAGIKNLAVYRDPKQKFARASGVLGLPISVILNRQGQEIARMRGDADWYSPEAIALLTALIAEQ